MEPLVRVESFHGFLLATFLTLISLLLCFLLLHFLLTLQVELADVRLILVILGVKVEGVLDIPVIAAAKKTEVVFAGFFIGIVLGALLRGGLFGGIYGNSWRRHGFYLIITRSRMWVLSSSKTRRNHKGL